MNTIKGPRRVPKRIIGSSARLAGLAGLILLGTACSAQSALSPVDAAWVEPGWITQARQEIEEYRATFVSCIEENGGQAEVAIGGNVSIFTQMFDSEGREIPGALDVTAQISETCSAIPAPTHWGLPMDDIAYDRMVDVRECIVAHGFEVSQPPAREVWLDQGPSFAWNPYTELFPTFSQDPLPADQLIPLLAACPQSGHGFLSVGGFPD